ncbi:Cytochrome c family protein [hydrothermal vent metagenome]|uniref:Cytochrome c family protein n=1 Tax=hydrothermal vent metagenome TaxID=652676 RepID=A0A3B0X652_9ZZZZ
MLHTIKSIGQKVSPMKYFIFPFLILLSADVFAAPHGGELYATHCSSCHGVSGDGGVGVPLALPSFLNSVSDTFLKKTIRSGRPGRIMPAFNALSDAQVNAIVKYVRNWSQKPAPIEDNTVIEGDSKNGKRLYEHRCAQCHGGDGEGGKGTGVTFSRKRDFPIIATALNNSGFLAAASDVMIRNTITYGREGTPMTSILVAGMSKQDINDVVAYIRSFESFATKLQKSLDDTDDELPVISVKSPYGMEETLENLKQAITDQNFTLIRTGYLERGLVEVGTENKKQVILHFCNFKFLFNALAIDPRVGMFLPCRITLIEKNGVVTLSAINPKRLSKLFNNHELNKYCDEMYDVYNTLLEDATL